MMGDGEIAAGSREASFAFMNRLDLIMTDVYPYEIVDEKKDALHFSMNSWSSTLADLLSIWRLAVVVFRPYVAVFLLGLAIMGMASAYCAAVGVALLGYLCLFDKRFGVAVLGRPPRVQPGLYCKRSPRTEAVISMVSALRHPYYKGTPWVIGGDVATIFPYLAFHRPNLTFVRRWLSVEADGPPKLNVKKTCHHDTDDGAATADLRENGGHDESDGEKIDYPKEAVALDLVFPEAGLDSSKPFYVILHGLNGGSGEGYVLDFTKHALERGSGVCIMVSRGAMGTPVRGESIFHGARISDAKATVQALRQALPPDMHLAMVGYSMGAIIAANYAAVTGANSGLSCCVSMSGNLDTRSSMTFEHGLRIWHPLLAKGLKDNFVVPNARKIAARGIDLQTIDFPRTVKDVDSSILAPFYGYPSVVDYYTDMSAGAKGKISGLKTPLLTVSALDDPIIEDRFPLDEIADNDHLFFLLTGNGGHVGWPVGWLPWRSNWLWMSSTALDFCEAIVATVDI